MGHIEDIRKKEFTHEKYFAILYFLKLKRLHVIPDSVDFTDFESHFKLITDSSNQINSIEIDDEALGITVELDKMALEITDKDIAETDRMINNAKDKGLEAVVTHAATKMVHAWIQQSPELLKKLNDKQSNFRDELTQIWGKSLELLHILLSTSLDTGVLFNDMYHDKLSEQDAFVFYVVNHLFGRACQVGNEIHILLSHGYADGAEARWRTLHEIVVIAIFIMQHDYDVAKRYVEHERIDTFKVMNSYREHWKSEGIEKITESEFNQLEQDKRNLINLYGKEFKNSYGWAAKALDKSKVSFFDLEKVTNQNYLRPMVTESHSNIHASSRGTSVRLGLPSDSNMILAGSSVLGIGEITLNTAFSILIIFENFLMVSPTIENKINVQAVYEILDLIQEANTESVRILNEDGDED